MERHWKEWIDTEIPMLDGLTPRKAVRTPAGREKVDALLKQAERDPTPGGTPERTRGILSQVCRQHGFGEPAPS